MPSIAWSIAAITSFLVLAVAPVLLVARRARAATGEARTPAWFAFWRTYRLAVEGGFILWLVASLALSLADPFAAAVPAVPRGVFTALVLFGPPLLVGFVAHVVARSVLSRLHGVATSAREAALEAAGRLLARSIPLLSAVLAVWSLLDDDAPGSPPFWILGAFASLLLGAALLRRASTFTPHALAEGELRDRAFELAGRARVPLRQLYVVPAAKTRMANAFASRGGTVLLTDYLVERLGRRELDAILAHELGHLRHRHVLLRPLAVTGAFVAAALLAGLASSVLQALFGDFPPERQGAVMVALVAGMLSVSALLAVYASARRQERVADRFAAELTSDPEALISALGRLSRLGLMPRVFGRLTETFTTHPATLRRAQAIALQFAIPTERMTALLDHGIDAEAGYPIPGAAIASSRLYTSPWKQAVLVRMSWTLTLAGAAVPIATGVAVDRLNLHGSTALAAYAIATVLAAALGVELGNVLTLRRYEQLRVVLAARLPPDEARAVAAGDGWFVGLGPAPAPRLYEGHGAWDVGHLTLLGDELVFRGDGSAFALPRSAVLDVRRGPGHPGWIRLENVYIDWQAADGSRRTFYARPYARTLRSTAGLTAPYADRLVAWHAQPETTIAPARLAPPAWGEVTGLSPKDAISGAGIFTSLVFLGVLAWATMSLLHAGGQLPAVLVVLAARYFFAVWPLLRYREPAGAPAPSTVPPPRTGLKRRSDAR
jgi:STE24 endopeptidase